MTWWQRIRRWLRWGPAPVEPPAPDPPTPDPPASTLVDAINHERDSRGLGFFRECERLTKQAQGHADAMEKRGRLSHDGFDERLRTAGYRTGSENVAHGQLSEREVIQSWMSSSGHRRNILGNYQAVGTARSGTYWCAIFGSK